MIVHVLLNDSDVITLCLYRRMAKVYHHTSASQNRLDAFASCELTGLCMAMSPANPPKFSVLDTTRTHKEYKYPRCCCGR